MLPVLQAAHIRPYAQGGEHRVDSGLLLRSDFHTLFDQAYITVTSDYQLEVSGRIREDWHNGEHYYRMHGHEVRVPQGPDLQPVAEFLGWYNEECYRG